MKITLSNTLPAYPAFVEGIRRAPDRGYTLTPAQTVMALKNALRYILPNFMNNLFQSLWKNFVLVEEFTVIVSVPQEI